MTKIQVRDNIKKAPNGRIRVFQVDQDALGRMTKEQLEFFVKNSKPIQSNNLVVDEAAQFFARSMTSFRQLAPSHMYGEYGPVGTFAENGGPFFTANKANQISDIASLAGANTDRVGLTHKFTQTQPGQSTYVDNVATFLGTFTQNDGDVYIGVNLVAELPTNEQLLLARVALPGILKVANKGILIAWDWIFTT